MYYQISIQFFCLSASLRLTSLVKGSSLIIICLVLRGKLLAQAVQYRPCTHYYLWHSLIIEILFMVQLPYLGHASSGGDLMPTIRTVKGKWRCARNLGTPRNALSQRHHGSSGTCYGMVKSIKPSPPKPSFSAIRVALGILVTTRAIFVLV